jgi:hypothetical protein
MASKENKTQPVKKTFKEFLDGIEDEQVRNDCKTLGKFMEKVSGEKPVIWGDVIVGFGKYHYKYASGHEGDSCLIGFAPRKDKISIYSNCSLNNDEQLLKSLGKFKKSKSCIYVKKVDDIDLDVLEKILKAGMKKIKELYS